MTHRTARTVTLAHPHGGSLDFVVATDASAEEDYEVVIFDRRCRRFMRSQAGGSPAAHLLTAGDLEAQVPVDRRTARRFYCRLLRQGYRIS